MKFGLFLILDKNSAKFHHLSCIIIVSIMAHIFQTVPKIMKKDRLGCKLISDFFEILLQEN